MSKFLLAANEMPKHHDRRTCGRTQTGVWTLEHIQNAKAQFYPSSTHLKQMLGGVFLCAKVHGARDGSRMEDEQGPRPEALKELQSQLSNQSCDQWQSPWEREWPKHGLPCKVTKSINNKPGGGFWSSGSRFSGLTKTDMYSGLVQKVKDGSLLVSSSLEKKEKTGARESRKFRRGDRFIWDI